MANRSCPYCGISFTINGVNAEHLHPHFESLRPHIPGSARRPDDFKEYSITTHLCPECRRQIIWLNRLETKSQKDEGGGIRFDKEVAKTMLLFPKRVQCQLPPEVPDKFAADYREAHDTLEISPKASAALSRRCLQNVIREQEGISKHTLYAEIDALIKLNKLPKYLADDLDSIRQVGNFAAHPIKDTNTGQIMEVESGEAEWTLEVLKELLIFYFVDAAKSQARRDALKQKLKAAGKG